MSEQSVIVKGIFGLRGSEAIVSGENLSSSPGKFCAIGVDHFDQGVVDLFEHLVVFKHAGGIIQNELVHDSAIWQGIDICLSDVEGSGLEIVGEICEKSCALAAENGESNGVIIDIVVLKLDNGA